MNIVIKYAELKDMEEVSAVHRECFKDYFSTKLGAKLLSKYYAAYLEKFPGLFVVAWDTDNNKIVGLANGYVVGQNIQKDFIKKNACKMALRVLWLLIKFDKVVWKRIKGMIKKEKAPEGTLSVKRGTGDLLSICVLKEYRGCGAAKGMVEKFEEGLRNMEIEEYVLTVFPDNIRARAFYEKCGFDVYYQTEREVKYIKKLK